jgi:hypothetical protein
VLIISLDPNAALDEKLLGLVNLHVKHLRNNVKVLHTEIFSSQICANCEHLRTFCCQTKWNLARQSQNNLENYKARLGVAAETPIMGHSVKHFAAETRCHTFWR